MTRTSRYNIENAMPNVHGYGVSGYWYWMMAFAEWQGAWQPMDSYLGYFNR